MFTDIHTHILHGIDDGPENFDQTIQLLKLSVKNGVENIVATPHFYATRHSLNERLSLANERFLQLSEFISQNNISISLLKGFEVRFFDGISRIDTLDKLCINNSKFILLELQPLPITETVVDEILNICYSGYNVILAHIERYAKISGFKLIKQLLAEGEVIAQCNASSFISGQFQRSAFRLLKDGMVSVIASDTHSVDARPPILNEAYKVIEKKFGTEIKMHLISEAEAIFKACSDN